MEQEIEMYDETKELTERDPESEFSIGFLYQTHAISETSSKRIAWRGCVCVRMAQDLSGELMIEERMPT